MINRRSFITGIKGTKLTQKEIKFLIKYKIIFLVSFFKIGKLFEYTYIVLLMSLWDL